MRWEAGDFWVLVGEKVTGAQDWEPEEVSKSAENPVRLQLLPCRAEQTAGAWATGEAIWRKLKLNSISARQP